MNTNVPTGAALVVDYDVAMEDDAVGE